MRYFNGYSLIILWAIYGSPDLSPRDRSIVTVSALIARKQTIEMPYHVNLALDNGVKPSEISEIVTHLAFYSGWAHAMSAVAVAKDVFGKRGIRSDQLPPASGALLPIDEAAEDQRHLHRELETLKQERASTMKRTLLTITIATFSLFGVMAQVPNKQSNQNPSDMNRIERAKKKSQELFGAQSVTNTSDPELMSILQGLIFGEIFYVGNLDDKTRELITITVLTTNQTLPQLKAHTNAALNIGVPPIQIREAVYQSAPFIGFPKVLNALDTINEVFTSRGIALPLENKGTVEENERFEKGREMQFPLYGDRMKEYMKDLPAEFAEAIPRILTESGFGDFYTRGGLDIKTRELLIFCALATLGGTERQMASHAVGNLKVGNSKETLLSAMVHSYPYIGFPRVANAISVIKEAKVE